MPFQPSQRALDFMRCVLPEQRRYFRVHLPIRATAVFRDVGIEPQTAFLRDVNMLGAFFYCRCRPNLGQNARLEFALPGQDDQFKAICEGRVVRVEEFGPERAIGVAIEFASYNLTQPPKSKEAGEHPQSSAFIGWTVEMVERMFEKLGQLTPRNPECGNAA